MLLLLLLFLIVIFLLFTGALFFCLSLSISFPPSLSFSLSLSHRVSRSSSFCFYLSQYQPVFLSISLRLSPCFMLAFVLLSLFFGWSHSFSCCCFLPSCVVFVCGLAVCGCVFSLGWIGFSCFCCFSLFIIFDVTFVVVRLFKSGVVSL